MIPHVGNGSLYYALTKDCGYLKVVGWGSFDKCNSLRLFYNQLLKSGIRRLIVDLQECTYMDSTFLGTLAGIHIKFNQIMGELKIVNVSKKNLDSIATLGLDKIFKILMQWDNAPFADHIAPFDRHSLRKEDTPLTMLEAHELLIHLDPRNKTKFQDLVDYLKEEVGKSASKEDVQ
ncbi:anti-anti-sigma factor [Methylacidiphilum sp. Yel]|jgi:anti-anti-sigma factor|uniref:STAS domain-containing protein n=1 Tax=Methylacidiphilum sp. Yel TaxID=1847730 RepID=UPI00106A5FC7|nr:STAS domain-containing protein [Methylacidiphilum sp. Yel]TFE70261.1 anti-anti-sigma factor [Methylacidiphilum sp. Yel]